MRTIVFARLNPCLRIFKLAAALKRTGKYRTILLCGKCDRKMFSKVFDEIIEFDFGSFLIKTFRGRNIPGKILHKLAYPRNRKLNLIVGSLWKKIVKRGQKLSLKKFADIIKNLESKVDLFHVVTEPIFPPVFIIKNTKKPVIYDVYDFSGIRFGVENLNTEDREDEKFCLENTAGISMKFPEWILNYYWERGYNINCPVFNLIDHCLPDFFAYRDNKLERDNIHLVYAGGVDSSFFPTKYYGNNQYFEIAQEIIKQKIYFHIYLPRDKKPFFDYWELSKKNKYLVPHWYQSQPELQKEISNYHFGCLLNDFSKTEHTKLFAETSFGNKTMTYLEAGLPMIVNEDLKLNTEYVEKNKVGFRINLKDLSKLREKILDVNYQELKNNVRIIRQGPFNIYNNIERLINFYEKIISEHNK